ncbi:MAG TPA: DUF2911 domain-containing protein [Opitutus sp.]|nr:DUF2911 domain-containing protein [Opitutus sp.]
MKTLRPLVLTAAFAATSLVAQPAKHAHSTGGHSPHETTSAVIGDRRTGDRVTVTYGRPFTADPKTGEPRKIWGALVPWDQPWRLGADEATLLITQQPIVFGETTIPAGAYTLYLTPSENSPTKLVFSTNLGKWGIPVDTQHDFASVAMTKSALGEPVNELTINVENDKAAGGGVLRIKWESTEFSAPFTVAK